MYSPGLETTQGGLATSDNQTTANTKLDTLHTDLVTVESKQDTGNTTLAGIKTDIETGNTTLATISAATQLLTITESIASNAFDINAAPYTATTNILVDYILDSIELHFSTSQSKTIAVTSAKGTVIYTDTNSLTDIFLNNLNIPFKANENFTITVTQTAGACSMNVYARTKTGTVPVLGTFPLTDYSLRVDDTTNYFYIGKATPGAATSASVWQVARIDTAGNKLFSGGAATYSNVWDNRLSLSYS